MTSRNTSRIRQARISRPAPTHSRDKPITRLSCAPTTSLALSVVQMPVNERVKDLFLLGGRGRHGCEDPVMKRSRGLVSWSLSLELYGSGARGLRR